MNIVLKKFEYPLFKSFLYYANFTNKYVLIASFYNCYILNITF